MLFWGKSSWMVLMDLCGGHTVNYTAMLSAKSDGVTICLTIFQYYME